MNSSIFEPIVNKPRIFCLRWNNKGYKDASLRRKNFVQSLGEDKLYPAALHRITILTVVSAQALEV